MLVRQWQDQGVLATITNPLPEALAHYARELSACLPGWRCETEGRPDSHSVEGHSGIARVARGMTLIAWRTRGGESDAHIVLWPAFGYLDALTWIPRARRQPVVLIVHDIDPLRRQFGHSAAARRVFGRAVRTGDVTVVCHTGEAGQRLEVLTGVRPEVVPHPMLEPVAVRTLPADEQPGRPVVRVLGQYKDARELELLTGIGADVGGRLSLEIWGRGWPAVPGWRVVPGFVTEPAFAQLVATSAAIVLPYVAYSQSGVMVRAAESGVPVVGVDHPQLRFLYGERWPGIVPAGGSWAAGIRGALDAQPSVWAETSRAHERTLVAWHDLMEGITTR